MATKSRTDSVEKISVNGTAYTIEASVPVAELEEEYNPQSRPPRSESGSNPFIDALLSSYEEGRGRRVQVAPEDFHETLKLIDSAKTTLDRRFKAAGEAGFGRNIRFKLERNGEPITLPKVKIEKTKRNGETKTVSEYDTPPSPVWVEFYGHDITPRTAASEQ